VMFWRKKEGVQERRRRRIVTISRLDCQSIGEINHGIGVPSTGVRRWPPSAWLDGESQVFMARFASLDCFRRCGRFLGVLVALRIDQNQVEWIDASLPYEAETPVIWDAALRGHSAGEHVPPSCSLASPFHEILQSADTASTCPAGEPTMMKLSMSPNYRA